MKKHLNLIAFALTALFFATACNNDEEKKLQLPNSNIEHKRCLSKSIV